MRAGILTYGLDRALMGIGRATKELIETLAQVQPELDLVPITPYRNGPFSHDSYRPYYLPGCRRLPALMTLGNLSVLIAAHKARLDIVHDPTSIGPFLFRSGWGRCKKVISIYDLVPFVYPESHTVLNNLLYKRWLPLVIGNVDAIVVPSEATRRDVIHYLGVAPQKIHVVYLGIGERFRPLANHDQARSVLQQYGVEPPCLLYVGGIEPRKNLTSLLKAYAMLRKDLPGYRLVVVGRKNWKYEAVFKLIDDLGLQKDVQFTGYVPDEHLPYFYGIAEVCVFPSLYEGFGFPPLEAMACGTPIVCSNTSSLPEIVGEAAITIDPHDTSALADSIRQAITDGDLREELRRRGLERAQSFTWQKTASETLAIYNRVVSGC